MTVERLDEEVRLPLDIPSIESGDPERLSRYLRELVSELQEFKLFDIHQRINLMLDLQAGAIIYLSTKDEDSEYADGTWRINGSSSTEYLIQLKVSGTWTTMLWLGSDGAVTITDLTLSSPSLIYALSHDSFADFLTSEHFTEASIDHTNIIAGTGADHSHVALNTTHRSSDGKDHSDVVLNNTHRASDGKNHSDVVLNNTHRTSDGKDHSDVVLNNTHRTSNGTDHSYIDQDVTTTASPTFAGLTTTAGRIKNTTRATTTYQILVTDDQVFCNTDGSAWTATLPAGAEGQTLRVINSGSAGNNLTLAPNGAEHLIGVNSNITLADSEAIDLTYNATDGWY